MFNPYLRMYNRLEEVSSSVNIKYVQYCNLCFTMMLFILILIVAIEVSPITKDAGILINDASETLQDYSLLVPKINGLIPEARNTTRILGHLIPEIKEGLKILRSLCYAEPKCNF